MIVNIGPKGKLKLLDFINRTWRDGTLPTAWKTATIHPVLMKGKEGSELKDYYPISCTSCICRLAEDMVNSRLYGWLETTGKLDSVEEDISIVNTTGDQLLRLSQAVLNGYQEQKDTTVVFVKLRQVHNKVSKMGLFTRMLNLGINGKMLSWMQAFLTNRLIQTCFDGNVSFKCQLESALPQGSALSCNLNLINMYDIPDINKVSRAQIADSLVIWTTDNCSIKAKRKLSSALIIISNFCKVNAEQTVYTSFTKSMFTKDKTLNLQIDGKKVRRVEPAGFMTWLKERHGLYNNGKK